MMKAKAPQESPEAKAIRVAEETRADQANLSSTQDYLGTMTSNYRRRYGLLKAPSGSQPTIVSGLAQLGAASNAGSTGSYSFLAPKALGGFLGRNGSVSDYAEIM